LLWALSDSRTDCTVWLQSYYEEKQGIQSLRTFKKITLGEYWTLCEKGVPKAIPTMCILTIKKDENLLSHGGQDDSILSAKLIRITPETSSF
jgi:hypothetical protein